MNNYFSDFISRFGSDALGLTSYSEIPDLENDAPRVSFLALYNPSWAKENDESFEGLSRQIVFFVNSQSHDNRSDGMNETSDDSKVLREHLNIIGLIRGAFSLLSDFVPSSKHLTVEISEGAIVVVEIEQGYFLVLYLVTNSNSTQQKRTCVKQLVKLVENTHRSFELTNSPLIGLIQLYGRKTTSEILQCYWLGFLKNFNFRSETPFGPTKILWPNRLNPRGFFDFFPKKCYKKSSFKLSETSKAEMDHLVFDGLVKPTGYFISNVGSEKIKFSGMVHMNLGSEEKLDHASVLNISRLFEDIRSSGALNQEFFCNLSKSENIYTLLRSKWEKDSKIPEACAGNSQEQDEDSPDEDLSDVDLRLNPAAALAMLHPVRLTNSLIVSPLNGTVRGLKNLGLAVTEQIYDSPNWLNQLNYFGSNTTGVPGSQSDTENVDEGSNCYSTEKYLIGLVGCEITRFLMNIPTTSTDGSTISREYSLIVYQLGDILSVLMYESGIADLENKSFYSDLETNLFQPLSELIYKNASGVGVPLSNSTSSLPVPIQAAVQGQMGAQAAYGDIDSEFFFIIYDTVNGFYQTSLPDLQMEHSASDTRDILDKQRSKLIRVIFHLHDHLITHFILETKERIFQSNSSAYEQLHKFSSSRSSDWLFYSMRHKEKVIVVIRNSNNKTNTKPPTTTENSYLMKVADSVYGAANLGFLESLGGDVRVWLGGVVDEPDAETTEEST